MKKYKISPKKDWGVKCCLPHCRLNRKSALGKRLKYFVFPSVDSPFFHLWMEACNLDVAPSPKKAYVCSIHFSKSAVGKQRLKKSSLPTQYLRPSDASYILNMAQLVEKDQLRNDTIVLADESSESFSLSSRSNVSSPVSFDQRIDFPVRSIPQYSTNSGAPFSKSENRMTPFLNNYELWQINSAQQKHVEPTIQTNPFINSSFAYDKNFAINIKQEPELIIPTSPDPKFDNNLGFDNYLADAIITNKNDESFAFLTNGINNEIDLMVKPEIDEINFYPSGIVETIMSSNEDEESETHLSIGDLIPESQNKRDNFIMNFIGIEMEKIIDCDIRDKTFWNIYKSIQMGIEMQEKRRKNIK